MLWNLLTKNNLFYLLIVLNGFLKLGKVIVWFDFILDNSFTPHINSFSIVKEIL